MSRPHAQRLMAGSVATAAIAAVMLAPPATAVASPTAGHAVSAIQEPSETAATGGPSANTDGGDQADPADSGTSSTVTVATQTEDGLSVTEVATTTPLATARSLDKQPGVVAGKSQPRRIFALSDNASGRDLQWPLNQLGAEDAWRSTSGAGVIVAVLDTGVDASHPDLAGRVLPGYDAIKRRGTGDTDTNGHGTHVAGTIAAHGQLMGVAPNAQILPVRVMNSRGGGSSSDVTAGIVWAVNQGADVINMSLGSDSSDKAEQAAVRWARSRGVIVVAAVGNDGSSAPMYPAAYKDRKKNAPATKDPVLGVGATQRSTMAASFSQRGFAVDLAAPGVRVLSTSPSKQGQYNWESGTSMAAPHVAGAAALAVAYLKANRRELSDDQRATAAIDALRRSAIDHGKPGTDKRYGSGSVDPVAALRLLGAHPTNLMASDAVLIGSARGRATALFTAPAGTTVVARLSSSPGAEGARPVNNPSDGSPVWSGVGGSRVAVSLGGLSVTASHTLTVFVTRGGVTTRTVTGLRPLDLKVIYPSQRAGGSRKLRIGTLAGPQVGVPGGTVAIDIRQGLARKTVRLNPATSRLLPVQLPVSPAKAYITIRVDGGEGNWPYSTTERVIRQR